MAEFLSDAWVAALDAAARGADDLGADPPLVVEQVVRRVDGTDARYQVQFRPDGASVTGVGSASADVVLVTDLDTAWELHQGTLRAQDAFARGTLKVRGRPEVLTGRTELFAAFERAVAPVRAGTTLPSAR
jgi:hypothetical protein